MSADRRKETSPRNLEGYLNPKLPEGERSVPVRVRGPESLFERLRELGPAEIGALLIKALGGPRE